MRVRDQLIGVVALAIATYFSVMRIAEAKCDAAVGSRGILLDKNQPDDFAAFQRLLADISRMGQSALAARLGELQQKKELWIAPALGPSRWAAYVDAIGLVQRIYIRRVALLNPIAHLFPHGAPPDLPAAYPIAFASLSLAGAMRHELAHRDGTLDEALAYEKELEWYEEVQASFVTSLEGEERAAWEWAVKSALLSARKAARRAGAM